MAKTTKLQREKDSTILKIHKACHGSPNPKPGFDAGSTAIASHDEPRARGKRRRQIDPTTCEREYSSDEVEFMKALAEYKRVSGRMFPTCSEILEVLKTLGYEKRPSADLAPIATPHQRSVTNAACV